MNNSNNKVEQAINSYLVNNEGHSKQQALLNLTTSLGAGDVLEVEVNQQPQPLTLTQHEAKKLLDHENITRSVLAKRAEKKAITGVASFSVLDDGRETFASI
jgi:hypothetical protein